MLHFFLSTDREEKISWDKPIEFPKPSEQPEIPVKQEPGTPVPEPQQPQIIPIEKPGIETPVEVPAQEQSDSQTY